MPNIFDKTTARVLATVLLFAAILAVLYLARKTFIIFLFAVFFAYLLEPVVERLQRSGKRSRGRAILLTYIGLLLIVIALLSIFGPRVASEGQKLAQSVPRLMENFNSGRYVTMLGERRGWSTETQARIQEFIGAHQDDIIAGAQSFAKRVAEVATNALWLILIPILAIFFLKDKEAFLSHLAQSADPGREQSFIRRILKDVDVMLARYIRAQLTIAALALVAYTVFLNVMRVPYAFAIGPVGGVLEFIPVIGPAITAVLIVGVSFLSGYQHVLVLLIFVGVWRMIQDYVTAPRLFGSGLELHPLASIFAVLVGGEVAGVVGMFLSVPVMAALRIVWRNWRQAEGSQETARPRAVV